MFNTGSQAINQGVSTAEAPSSLVRDHITVSEIEHLLSIGIPVYLNSGVEVRRVIALPATASA